ncbi:hypothetical protein [Hydrogenophaga sp.]|uniref:hypothetical protein n=1 Tax=Hydrogenophaga sp. TaxID=1904254 RepID=UPI0035632566
MTRANWQGLDGSTAPNRGRSARWLAATLCALCLSGCAVVAVTGAVVSATVGVAGLAVDAAVGTARIGGKVIGATADAALGSDEAAE